MECQLKSIPSSCLGIALISVTILPVLYIKLIPFLNVSNAIGCWSLLYSAVLWSWADSLCLYVILREWLAAFFIFIVCFWISTKVVYLQRWHGWCHIKLLPSQWVLCTPYNHAPCHFMQSVYTFLRRYVCSVCVCVCVCVCLCSLIPLLFLGVIL